MVTMADSPALRNRRARWHRSGNHDLCRNCDAKATQDGPDGPVVRAHRAELEAIGLANTAEASIVLALAGLLDAQKGAMGAAATADRLDRLMDRLRKRRPAVKTPLDELRERRARRGA